MSLNTQVFAQITTAPIGCDCQGKTQREAPEIVGNIVEGNWMAPASEMQLGLRVMRVVAIVRE
eukprot:1589556-Pyramimonas_sp.AAC.1